MRMDYIGAGVVFSAAVCGLSGGDSTTPAFLGLGLAYAVMVSDMLGDHLLALFCK